MHSFITDNGYSPAGPAFDRWRFRADEPSNSANDCSTQECFIGRLEIMYALVSEFPETFANFATPILGDSTVDCAKAGEALN